MNGMFAGGQKTREILVEDTLRSHPGVHDVAALRGDSGRIVAFVVPEESYLKDELGCGDIDSLNLSKWRKTYDLSQLTKEAIAAEPGFNTAGWNSSYTRQPIPETELREWLEATVAEVLQLRPRRVYEIGCGTGLLLTRIAAACEQYLAADFSSAVLTGLRQQLRAFPALERVTLTQRLADDFSGIDAGWFDTVVLNSVVQYFPSLSYLTSVLEQAIRVVKPGGYIFIGDVRSLQMLPLFANSVELFQSADESSVGELKSRVYRRIEREKELVLSPAYFLDLQSRFATISRVEIRPERGHANNEMTRYRYHALLRVGHRTEPVLNIEFHDWEKHRWSLESIQALLARGIEQSFGIKGIQNARIARDLTAIEILNGASTADTIGTVRNRVAPIPMVGISPEELLDLQVTYPAVAIHLSWLAARQDGSYDALIMPSHLQEIESWPAVNWPRPAPSDLLQFANAPGREKIRRDLVRQVQAYATENLPPEKVLGRIELVDSLVMDANGEI